jgi:hypothetical protein
MKSNEHEECATSLFHAYRICFHSHLLESTNINRKYGTGSKINESIHTLKLKYYIQNYFVILSKYNEAL